MQCLALPDLACFDLIKLYEDREKEDKFALFSRHACCSYNNINMYEDIVGSAKYYFTQSTSQHLFSSPHLTIFLPFSLPHPKQAKKNSYHLRNICIPAKKQKTTNQKKLEK